ncbi:6852_t:CDS:2, partial [Acaulospora morrowiae]
MYPGELQKNNDKAFIRTSMLNLVYLLRPENKSTAPLSPRMVVQPKKEEERNLKTNTVQPCTVTSSQWHLTESGLN